MGAGKGSVRITRRGALLQQGLDRLATVIARGKPQEISWDDWKKETREALEELFGTRFHATHLKDRKR